MHTKIFLNSLQKKKIKTWKFKSNTYPNLPTLRTRYPTNPTQSSGNCSKKKKIEDKKQTKMSKLKGENEENKFNERLIEM